MKKYLILALIIVSKAYSNPLCCDQCFQGFYVGAHAGWALHQNTWNDRNDWARSFGTDISLSSTTTTISGAIGGAQAGFNQRLCHALYGLEVDVTASSSSRTKNFRALGQSSTIFTMKERLGCFGTIRGRAGLIASGMLLYVTGGAAIAGIQQRWSVAEAGILLQSFRHQEVYWGLCLGGGVEWELGSRWSLKAEGLYFRFPERTKKFAIASDIFVFDLQNSTAIVRVGFNYRFSNLFGCF